MIQVYGAFNDFMSMATVSRAVCAAFAKKKWELTIRSTGHLVPWYEDAPWPKMMDNSAKVGVYIGYPATSTGWLKGHDIKVLITVCETNAIPREWVSACNEMNYVVVPSEFCRKVFSESGVKPPIVVAPHGVSTNLMPPPIVKSPKLHHRVNFLHVTGAISFPRRKGTPQLLIAWKTIEQEFPDAFLYLKMFTEARMMKFIHDLGLKNIKVDSRTSFKPVEMYNYISKFDATIQPSRGEGFGIVPLEGRCIGTPAILTNYSGHSDHYACGDVDIPVETGQLKPMFSQNNDCGFAPDVEPEAIIIAIRKFMNDIDGYRTRTANWATSYRKLWDWENSLRPLIHVLKPVMAKKNKLITLGQGLRGA